VIVTATALVGVELVAAPSVPLEDNLLEQWQPAAVQFAGHALTTTAPVAIDIAAFAATAQPVDPTVRAVLLEHLRRAYSAHLRVSDDLRILQTTGPIPLGRVVAERAAQLRRFNQAFALLGEQPSVDYSTGWPSRLGDCDERLPLYVAQPLRRWCEVSAIRETGATATSTLADLVTLAQEYGLRDLAELLSEILRVDRDTREKLAQLGRREVQQPFVLEIAQANNLLLRRFTD
jgi:hypothetical protein